MSPVDLPQRLAEAVQRGLPGAVVQREMEPELACGRHFHPPPLDVRPAAVAIALYQRDAVWHVPLVVRPQTMRDHAGQIGLPGGALDPGEESGAAALRELHEELGVVPDAVRLIGSLSPIWVFGTNFLVTPWLAVVEDFAPCPAASEVAELLEMPLPDLLDPANRSICLQRRAGLEFYAPCFRWRDHVIWGATALVLRELIALVTMSKVPTTQ